LHASGHGTPPASFSTTGGPAAEVQLTGTSILNADFCVKTTNDATGRIVVPKALRDRSALAPGSEIEVAAHRRVSRGALPKYR
jgi:hypothetical protein